ncbi:MAG: chemotaxis protein CheB, partial [Bacteroidia bacterium]
MQSEQYKLIVIGGSAGSIDAIIRIIPKLSKDFSIPIVIVLHRKASKESSISAILQHRTSLKIKEAEEKEKITNGTVYFAPPDYHLLIESDNTFSLDASEKIHFSRPSIDVTFESAAGQYKQKLIGILLTGANDDGAKGIKDIAHYGGFTIAQEPNTAEV